MVRALILCSLPLAAAQELAPWTPPPGCDAATWGVGECCCAFCSSRVQGTSFTPLNKTECFHRGGQCKAPQMSSYQRRSKAALAPVEPTEHGEPEQTHLIGGYPDEVTVVFVTNALAESRVEFRLAGDSEAQNSTGSSDTYSVQVIPTGWQGYESKFKQPGPEFGQCDGGFTAYYNSSCMYTSDLIHTVKLEGLTPASAYEYRPAGSRRWRSFTTPPAVGQPINFGVVADLGQSIDAVKTMRHMRDSFQKGRIDTVIFPGDLSYADGFAPAWDRYGRLSEFIWESLPAAYVAGNHEYGNGHENFVNFLPRYGWPSKARSKSTSNQWFSFDSGMAHVINLCSYCDYSLTSFQRAWLQADLEAVDRSRTPWLLVAMHAPWYTANVGHQAEALPMRKSMEELFYKHKVDVVFTGHVHAYDRTHSVYNNASVCDGFVHITIGDGGNHEGPSCGWDHFEWSAFTENSFGYGELDIVNSSHAHWSFYRNQDSHAHPVDSVWLRPAAQRCSVEESSLLV